MWPFSPQVIVLLSGPGGDPLTPLPAAYTRVAGAPELVVHLLRLLRPVLTGSPEVLTDSAGRLRFLAPMRLLSGLGASAVPGPAAGEVDLTGAGDSGSVSWMRQQCGAGWGRVCLPLFLMAALAGSSPAHPRTEGQRVNFSVGLRGLLGSVHWKEGPEAPPAR